MSINRKAMKQGAKDAMRQTRPRPIWVTLGLTLVLMLLTVLTMVIDGEWAAYMEMFQASLEGTLLYVEPSGTTSFWGWLLSVALQVMMIELTMGFVLYAMRVSRLEKPGFGDLFDSFGMFFRVIWIYILPSLLLALWSLIYAIPAAALSVLVGGFWPMAACLPLLIPMIRASYGYRQATYLMFDHPEMTCMQCIRRSRDMMDGHKWELFKLDLSFIGWYLLCMIPFVALWVLPYISVTRARYFDAISQDYAAKCPTPTPPTPPTPPEV
ncbi:MAG: DUF975 family protein [Oscillospiraceae bacterium]|nr:DUF975 family protein [Oscillospiraceae bacterium]